jgi:hypothetical protein
MTRALKLHWVLDGIYCHLFDGIAFCSLGPPEQCSFMGRNFAKFRPKKYDLDLDKGFSKKNDSDSPDFEGKKIQITGFL